MAACYQATERKRFGGVGKRYFRAPAGIYPMWPYQSAGHRHAY